MIKNAKRSLALLLCTVMLFSVCFVGSVGAEETIVGTIASADHDFVRDHEKFEVSKNEVSDSDMFAPLPAKHFVGKAAYTVPPKTTIVDNNGTPTPVEERFGSHSNVMELNVPVSFSADATGFSLYAYCDQTHDLKNALDFFAVLEDESVVAIDNVTTCRGRVTKVNSIFPSTIADPSQIKQLKIRTGMHVQGKIHEVLESNYNYIISDFYENDTLPEIPAAQLVRGENSADGKVLDITNFDQYRYCVPNFWTVKPTLKTSNYFRGIPGMQMTASAHYDGTIYINCQESFVSFEVKEDLSVYEGLQFYVHFPETNQFQTSIWMRFHIGGRVYSSEVGAGIPGGVSRCRLDFDNLSLVYDAESALHYNSFLYKFDRSMVSQISDIQLYLMKGGTYEDNVTKNLDVVISDIYGYTNEKDNLPMDNIYNFVVPQSEVVNEEIVNATKAAYDNLPPLNKASYSYEEYERIAAFVEAYGSASFKTLEAINKLGISDDVYNAYYDLQSTIETKLIFMDDCTVTLKATDYIYTGKAYKPAVTVKYGTKKLKKGTDYKVTYKNNKKAGTASVVITGMAEFIRGETTANFTITNIKKSKVTLNKVTAKKKGKVNVSWKKLTGASGYKVVYGTDKKLKKAKTVTIKKDSKLSTTLKKLKKGTKVYVKVCAFRKVKGKTTLGKYSAVKSVKVK